MRKRFSWTGSFRRRSVFVALMALAVLLLMVVPGSARVTHNESNSGFQLDASWPEGNNAGMADAGSWQVAWVNVNSQEECEPDKFIQLNINGQADEGSPITDLIVEPTKGKDKLTSGFGEAVFLVEVNYNDECAATGFGGQFEATVTIDLTGDGPLGKSRNSNSTVLPGDNSHDRSQETFRMATGTVEIDIPGADGGLNVFFDLVDGKIAAVTWSSHQNSH